MNDAEQLDRADAVWAGRRDDPGSIEDLIRGLEDADPLARGVRARNTDSLLDQGSEGPVESRVALVSGDGPPRRAWSALEHD